ncbi:MAG: GMC family oxidoreductase [Myxococcota bacterium]
MPLLDARDLTDGHVVSGRVCVAGAGAAGITIARELAAAGVDVVLLEGGGLEREESSQQLYAGDNTGDYDVQLDTCRSRHLGGSTNCWAGWCRPLEAEDFEARDWLEGSGWPVDAQHMAPYYARARQTVEIGADEWDADGIATRTGASTWDLDPARTKFLIYQYSPPTRFWSFYGPQVEASDRITTIHHANVVDIQLTADGSAVQRLDCATLEGLRFTAECDHYVIAMGGIDNARILLASNSQEPAGVGNATGRVGTCFMEHPHFYRRAVIALRADVDASFYLRRRQALTFDDANPDGLEAEYIPALTLPPAVRETEGLVGMAATLSRAQPDEVLGSIESVQADQLRAFIRGMPDDLQLLKLTIRSEQRPTTDSRVTLGDELDPLGVPRVDVQWRLTQADYDDVHRTIELWSAGLAYARLGRMWMPTTEDGHFDPGIVDGGCHHMGTTRMSADAATGVVDPDCRVHGVDNLYMAGSSIFPTGGFANPTLTIIAFAHRLANHLATLSG